MKPLTFKLLSVLLIAALFWIPPASAIGKKEFSKVIEEEFDISAEGRVALENKYGQVTVNTWERNHIELKVSILVNARSEESAQKVFDRIDIHIDNTSSSLNVQTEIGEGKSSWSWWSGWTKDDSDYNIHYEVMMPKTNQLSLKNKYGNSYVALMDGSTKVEVKYGNLDMEGVQNDLDLTLGYGNANIAFAKNTSIDVKYSNIDIEELEDLNILSKYSTMTFGHIQDLKATSKYDKYTISRVNEVRSNGKYDKMTIEEVNKIIANAKYSNYKLNHLTESADFDLSYGGASIRNLKQQFSEVNIVGSYADFSIDVEGGVGYQIDVDTDYADLDYPTSMNVTYEHKESHSKKVQANMGGKSGGLIKARLKYGGIEIND